MNCKEKFRLREFGLEYEHPKDFVTLEIGRPVYFIPWTVFWAIFHFTWICLEGYWWSESRKPTLSWFRRLSNVGYTVLTAAAIIDMIISVYTYCSKFKKEKRSNENMTWYLKLSWVLFNISNAVATLITVVYWTLLSDTDETVKAGTINKHGLNFIYVLIVICVSRKPVKFQHFYIPIIFSFLYMMFTLIYFAATGDYIYSLLNWNKAGKAIIWMFIFVFVCIPLTHFAIFGLYIAKIILKQKWFNRQDACGSVKFESNLEGKVELQTCGETSTAELLPHADLDDIPSKTGSDVMPNDFSFQDVTNSLPDNSNNISVTNG